MFSSFFGGNSRCFSDGNSKRNKPSTAAIYLNKQWKTRITIPFALKLCNGIWHTIMICCPERERASVYWMSLLKLKCWSFEFDSVENTPVIYFRVSSKTLATKSLTFRDDSLLFFHFLFDFRSPPNPNSTAMPLALNYFNALIHPEFTLNIGRDLFNKRCAVVQLSSVSSSCCSEDRIRTFAHCLEFLMQSMNSHLLFTFVNFSERMLMHLKVILCQIDAGILINNVFEETW